MIADPGGLRTRGWRQVPICEFCGRTMVSRFTSISTTGTEVEYVCKHCNYGRVVVRK